MIIVGAADEVGTPAAQGEQQPARSAEGYQLSFVDSDISDVVGSVIADALPALCGRTADQRNMTVQSAIPLSREMKSCGDVTSNTR